jgi:hypothetical protein
LDSESNTATPSQAQRRAKTKHEPKPEGWLAKSKIRANLEAVDLFKVPFVRLREDLKDGGLSPDQAWQQAWLDVKPLYDQRVFDLAQQSVARVTHPQQTGQLISPEVFEVLERKGGVNFRSDIEWVYSNLSNKDVLPGDSPNTGAWAMLDWARQNKHEFFTSLFAKVLPTKSQIDADQAKVDDGGAIRLIAECERDLIARLEGTMDGVGGTAWKVDRLMGANVTDLEVAA